MVYHDIPNVLTNRTLHVAGSGQGGPAERRSTNDVFNNHTLPDKP